MLRILICATLVALPLLSTTGLAGDKKNYEDCRALAVSRGLMHQSVDAGQRYQRLKVAGHTAHPTGFIARCMAGIQD
jgi:hypothetical protein